jgi:hypothetical protein
VILLAQIAPRYRTGLLHKSHSVWWITFHSVALRFALHGHTHTIDLAVSEVSSGLNRFSMYVLFSLFPAL